MRFLPNCWLSEGILLFARRFFLQENAGSCLEDLPMVRNPLLQRGGSSFLLFRDAEGMVEGTRFGRVGADRAWSPPKRSGRRQANKRCPRSATSQTLPRDIHRRDSGSETVSFFSAAAVAPQRQWPPRRVGKGQGAPRTSGLEEAGSTSLTHEVAGHFVLQCRQGFRSVVA